jgi:hypothetical protein
MRVQTNTLLRYKVFDQNMYKIRLPSVVSLVSKPIVTNLKSSVHEMRKGEQLNAMQCNTKREAKGRGWELTPDDQ